MDLKELKTRENICLNVKKNKHNNKGENNPMYGRKGENNPVYGTHWKKDPETGKRIYYKNNE